MATPILFLTQVQGPGSCTLPLKRPGPREAHIVRAGPVADRTDPSVALSAPTMLGVNVTGTCTKRRQRASDVPQIPPVTAKSRRSSR